MKFLKTKILAVLFIFVGLLFVFTSTNVYASETSSIASLHKQTKIYNSNNDDYFSGCEDYSDYENISPTITVLTHGLGSSASYFSNERGVDNKDFISYNSASIIAKMFDKLQGKLDVYVADCITIDNTSGFSYDFELHKYSMDDYKNNNVEGITTDIIDNVDNHILIVYDSDIPDESNEEVYNEFHYLMDNISLQYKNLTGILPRLNLVGHSRGGLTNIMYATEHIYNVASIYSMGSPYSGSALGDLDIVLGLMDYTDEYYNIKNNGVKSILDDLEAKSIRDAWNDAYTADANVNVVALGAMASIDFVRTMILDIENNPSYEEYNALISDYMDLINSVINFIDSAPELTSTALNFVNGFAELLNDFGFDIFDAVFSNINSNLEGKITYEEVDKVLNLFNVINDEFVLMDDLFIDTNSQLGLGFSDGISYNGFKRYVKIFDNDDFSYNRAISNQPGVVHNLEPFNDDFTNLIVNSLVYGSYVQDSTPLYDGFSTVSNFNCGESFVFIPSESGTRSFVANGCKIELFKYNADGGVNLVSSGEDELSYRYEKGESYLIIASSPISANIVVSFILMDTLDVGSNTILVYGNDTCVRKVKASTSGYYIIKTNNSNISLSNVNYISSNNYYVYLQASVEKRIIINNNSLNSTYVSINFIEPGEMQLNQSYTVNQANIVQQFINPYDDSLSFKLSINFSSARRVYVYNQNGSLLGSVTSTSTSYIRTFTLAANQKCYIVYSNSDSSITSKLTINESQYRWLIDGNMYTTTNIILPRNNTYDIEFAVYANGAIVVCETPIVTGGGSKYDYSAGELYIYSSTNVGYDISLYPTIAPEFMLTITVGYNSELTFSITNSDTVTLTYDALDNNCDAIKFRIYNSTNGNQYITVDNPSDTIDITSYLGNSNGYTYIYVVSITFEDVTFSNYTNCLYVNGQTVHNYFFAGSGTSSNPFQIKCQRHLNNIRYSTTSYYKLNNNIYLSGDWTPIDYFFGEINGNYKYIYDLKLNASTSGNRYGFVNYNGGVMKNIKFKYASISTTLSENSNRMNIGVVCGYNAGDINNCDTYNSKINLELPYVFVGDICGENSGYIYYSDSSNATLDVSHLAGGVCGFNHGIVELSYCMSISIEYHHISYNGRIGGIVGENHADGEVKNCYSSGNLYWTSPNKNSSIAPMIGKIIGANFGSYSDCSSDMGYSFEYYYWYFIGYFDQGKYLLACDDGNVGYQN
ncbi:MAG: GLUG motif-containing protein [Anaeroplasmataceae bacterium]